ncbi:MAG: hypothetical protein JO022_12425, partial [Acidobacteriaceae bacterium]|nr:hypothetical protein [Acidobacteriaceae bacterium]
MKDVLGYSEAFFLAAIPFLIFRSLGCDSFLSFELVLLVLKAIGFFGMLWLLRRFLNLNRTAALAGASLFTLSNVYYVHTGHAHLMAVALLPVLICLILSYRQMHNLGENRRALVFIGAAATLHALLFFTAFYIGWFTALCGAVFLVVYFLARRTYGSDSIPLASYLRGHLPGIVVGLLVFCVMMTPFCATYLPIMKQTGGRTFAEALLYSAEPIDVINIGPDNLVWRPLLRDFMNRLWTRPGGGEK